MISQKSKIQKVLCLSIFWVLVCALFDCEQTAWGQQRVRLGDTIVIPNGQMTAPLIGNTSPPRSNLPPAQILFPQQPVIQQPQILQQGFPTTLPQGVIQQPTLPQLQNPFPIQTPQQFPQQIQQPQVIPGTIPGTAPVVIQQPGFDPFAVQNQQIIGGGGGPLSVPILNVPGGTTQSTTPPPFIYPPPAGPITLPQPSLPPLPNAAFPGGQFNGQFPGGQFPGGQFNGQFPNAGLGFPGVGNYNIGSPGFGDGSWASSALAWPSQFWARLRSSNVYRLLERPRWRHTYLAPDVSSGSRGLGLNETEIATTLSVPNFLFSNQPIRISPGFAFHFWDGPNTPATGADLPGQTYSAYLANDFTTPWNRPFGAEVNLTVGVYTDFDEVTSDSIRITGLGLGWFRLNNTTTFKVGVEYLDRVRVKLLPAIGFFIYPTPDLKLDIYFPRPKLAQRLPNLGNSEVWGYIGGEYGGGSWTVERITGVGDQVDVNDIRAFIGVEWLSRRHITGFLEAGYVFDREIVYRSAPNSEIDIDDTFMFRAGLAF